MVNAEPGRVDSEPRNESPMIEGEAWKADYYPADR